MATRMQQRRGTAAQWTNANPVLAAGEIGFETDTNKFKIGDGSNQWSSLDYFTTIDNAILDIVAGAPAALDTLNELAAALGDDANFATTVTNSLANKQDKITGVSDTEIGYLAGVQSDIQIQLDVKAPKNSPEFTGTVVLPTSTSIGDVSSLEIGYLNGVTSGIQAQINSKADSATVSTTYAPINSPTFTGDVSLPVTTTIGNLSSTEVGYLATVTSDVQAQLDSKAPTANPTFTGTVSGVTKAHVGLGNVDNTSDANKPVSTATQTALDAKASLSGATFTGDVTVETDLIVDGNLTVSGTTTTVSAQDLVVSDPLIYIGEGNTANLVDLGLVSSYNDGTYQHAGIVRDSSANKWKIFKGVTDEPTTTVNFAQGSLDDLAVNNVEVAGVVFSDGTQTKQGVPSITTINAKTDSYTLANLNERDSIIEINKSTATTLTIPTNASVAYPVGTTLDIIQTGAGQVTIAGAGGVTVNATPGLKLRTQWSSATLLKRAENTWLVYGDLTA